MTVTIPTPPRCIIRGHDHDVTHVRYSVQVGTGSVMHVWECPTGAYRWLCVEGRELSNLARMKRPRWGWPN
ncbi:hypothetical protein ACFY05_32745 [Microtetraspora fusca]|uniref:Uncharacterized protein n=1 Tax=Microtetraspora fusca TaxID=1997 RepID=A0ABW6VE75_MICFU